MPDEPSSDRKGGFLAFWTTLPGILTGVAALITAIVGAVGLWKSQSGGNSTPASANRPATAGTETGAPQGTASGVARGRLSLVRGDYADLERAQIGNSATTDVIFGPESTPTLHSTASAFLAPVQGRPTKRACTTALRARRDNSEIVSQLGTKWVCVSTTEGNVAVVRIISAPRVGSAKLVLGYTVWP